ncbi:MAG: hypothetical protein ACI85Q_002747 [Salibacteraceae bacterium]|jgi:hypothetical protein
MIRYIFFFLLFFGTIQNASSQILISIILGDKLNSEGLEFGLDGGVNFSQITGMESAHFATNIHLGFYFDIRLKSQWWLNTGVLVKSSQGASSLSENDVLNLYPESLVFLDSGSYSQSLGYFNVPIMIKYKFKNYLFMEMGTQLAILTNARINYSHEYNDIELNTSSKNTDSFNRIDAGIVAGLGYKLQKGEGINIGVKYYQGLLDISKGSNLNNYNRVFYLKVDIPIGRKKENESTSSGNS